MFYGYLFVKEFDVVSLLFFESSCSEDIKNEMECER